MREHSLPRASPRGVDGRIRVLDGAQEAHLIILACSKPPGGQRWWTLRLLAERLVELDFADAVSHETVWRTRQNELKLHLLEIW